MSFVPDVDGILQYATNFFASGYPIAQVVIGIAIGGLVLSTIVGIVVSRRRAD